MAWSGSCQDRGSQAAGAALALGATPLEALIVGDSASYGETCWLTDASQSRVIVQRNGRHPHPRSVARARRNVTAKGLLGVRRIMPGHKPPGAKYASSAGTTAKSVDFACLRVRDPLTRAERRRLHKRGSKEQKRRTPAAVNAPTAPPSSRVSGAAVALSLGSEPPRTTSSTMDPELAALIESVGARLSARWQAAEDREDAAMLRSIPPKPPKPPDG